MSQGWLNNSTKMRTLSLLLSLSLRFFWILALQFIASKDRHEFGKIKVFNDCVYLSFSRKKRDIHNLVFPRLPHISYCLKMCHMTTSGYKRGRQEIIWYFILNLGRKIKEKSGLWALLFCLEYFSVRVLLWNDVNAHSWLTFELIRP